VKDLKKETSFVIGTCSNSKWISNEKSEKLQGLEFNRISSLFPGISSWLFKFE
jgi:hypothetical protein